MSLEELNRSVHSFESNGKISKSQADTFKNQIKGLVLQVAVDSYAMQGLQARQSGKNKLALHYYDTALNLIVREGKASQFGQATTRFKTIIAALSEQLHIEEPEAEELPIDPEAQQELESEWDKFDSSSKESVWKKKQVYD